MHGHFPHHPYKKIEIKKHRLWHWWFIVFIAIGTLAFIAFLR